MEKFQKLSNYIKRYPIDFKVDTLKNLDIVFQNKDYAIIVISIDELFNKDYVKVVKAPEGYIIISMVDDWILEWDISKVFLHLKYDETRDIWYSDLRAYLTIQDALNTMTE